jgi:hypothetical protein
VTYFNDLDKYTKVADVSDGDLETQSKTVEWRWTTIKDKWIQSVSIENQKEISSADEIAIYKKISKTSDGEFKDKIPIFDDGGTKTGKPRRVSFLTYIVAAGPRPSDYDPGYIIYYVPHKVGIEWLKGGYGNDSIESVIKHEKGHAKAYFEKIKKLMEAYLNENFRNHTEFSKGDMDKITKKYQELYNSAEHKNLTVKFSNEASINYHDSRPDKYKRLKATSISFKLPDGTYKKYKTSYVWKVLK